MSVPIVGSSIPLAVGAALANKLNNNDSMVVVFFGDGAVEEGVFHESLNFASINNLRIAFVCENNDYSIFTPLKERQPNRPLTLLGEAHGIKSYEIDEVDTITLKRQIGKIFSIARKTTQPCFLVLNTFRLKQHCGVQTDDHLGYRSKEQIRHGKDNDPINITCAKAINEGFLNKKQLKEIRNKLNIKISRLFDKAENQPLPTPEMAKKYVYWSKS
jgi:pyruvate dehydrogenase E1 component alpha subunit